MKWLFIFMGVIDTILFFDDLSKNEYGLAFLWAGFAVLMFLNAHEVTKEENETQV